MAHPPDLSPAPASVLTPQHQHCPRSGRWLTLLTSAQLQPRFSPLTCFLISDSDLSFLTSASWPQHFDLAYFWLWGSQLSVLNLLTSAYASDYKSVPPDLSRIAPGILISSLWPQPFDLSLLTPAFWPLPSVFSLLTSAHWPLPTNLNLGLAATLTLTTFWFPILFLMSDVYILNLGCLFLFV